MAQTVVDKTMEAYEINNLQNYFGKIRFDVLCVLFWDYSPITLIRKAIELGLTTPKAYKNVGQIIDRSVDFTSVTCMQMPVRWCFASGVSESVLADKFPASFVGSTVDVSDFMVKVIAGAKLKVDINMFTHMYFLNVCDESAVYTWVESLILKAWELVREQDGVVPYWEINQKAYCSAPKTLVRDLKKVLYYLEDWDEQLKVVTAMSDCVEKWDTLRYVLLPLIHYEVTHTITRVKGLYEAVIERLDKTINVKENKVLQFMSDSIEKLTKIEEVLQGVSDLLTEGSNTEALKKLDTALNMVTPDEDAEMTVSDLAGDIDSLLAQIKEAEAEANAKKPAKGKEIKGKESETDDSKVSNKSVEKSSVTQNMSEETAEKSETGVIETWDDMAAFIACILAFERRYFAKYKPNWVRKLARAVTTFVKPDGERVKYVGKSQGFTITTKVRKMLYSDADDFACSPTNSSGLSQSECLELIDSTGYLPYIKHTDLLLACNDIYRRLPCPVLLAVTPLPGGYSTLRFTDIGDGSQHISKLESMPSVTDLLKKNQIENLTSTQSKLTEIQGVAPVVTKDKQMLKEYGELFDNHPDQITFSTMTHDTSKLPSAKVVSGVLDSMLVDLDSNERGLTFSVTMKGGVTVDKGFNLGMQGPFEHTPKVDITSQGKKVQYSIAATIAWDEFVRILKEYDIDGIPGLQKGIAKVNKEEEIFACNKSWTIEELQTLVKNWGKIDETDWCVLLPRWKYDDIKQKYTDLEERELNSITALNKFVKGVNKGANT